MKKIKGLVLIFLVAFLFICNVSAADECTECAKKGISCYRCGQACELNSSNVCVVNEAAKKQLKEDMGSCVGYTYAGSCKYNNHYACVWNETKYGNYCNTDNLLYVACGEAFDIPHRAPELISLAVNLLKIATPIILIFVSVISLLKALAASKEDEIKKAQSSLIKKIIAAVMVFFIIQIVQFVISKVADSSEKGGVESCLACFLNNDCEKSLYYKVNIAGDYKCISVDNKTKFENCKGD